MTKTLASLFMCVGLFSFASEHQPCQPLTPTAATPFDTCRYLPPGKGVHSPKAVYIPSPDYPEAARKANLLNGSVALALAVNEKGGVDYVKVVRSSDQRFEPTTIDTVKQWEFAPATKNGKPIAVQINVETSFQLH